VYEYVYRFAVYVYVSGPNVLMCRTIPSNSREALTSDLRPSRVGRVKKKG